MTASELSRDALSGKAYVYVVVNNEFYGNGDIAGIYTTLTRAIVAVNKWRDEIPDGRAWWFDVHEIVPDAAINDPAHLIARCTKHGWETFTRAPQHP